MINLFHLLPPAASKFLEQLVMMTVSLERALPQNGVHSEVNSLYRKPLCKFLSSTRPRRWTSSSPSWRRGRSSSGSST